MIELFPDIIDDSRCLRTGKGLSAVMTPMGWADIAYCVSCHTNHTRSIFGGDGRTRVTYICPSCSEKYNKKAPEGMSLVPGTEGV
jgi:hypothetical protein